MRRILLFCVLLILSLRGRAQGFNENFSSNNLPSGWNNSYQIAGGAPWTFSSGVARVLNRVTGASGVAGPSWLISSVLTPEPGYATLVLTLNYPQSVPIGESTLEVRISNGVQNQLGTYTFLHSITRTATGTNQNGTLRIPIPPVYWNTPCYVAFMFTATGVLASDEVTIDNVYLDSDILYAVGSGKASGSIWSLTQTGPGLAPNISANTHLVIQNGLKVDFDLIQDIAQLTINPAAEITVSGKLGLYGKLTNKGKFNSRSGMLQLKGRYTQFIDGSSVYGDVQVSNPSVIEMQSGQQLLYGYLEVDTGLVKTNGLLVIASDSTSTGGIGKLKNNAVQGNVMQQRYLPKSDIDWRFLSVGTVGSTLSELNDDIRTSGYPGSSAPSNPFVSVRKYKESNGGPVFNGFIGVNGSTEIFEPGKGYYVHCSDLNGQLNPINLDFVGGVYQGDINVNLSYTNTSSPEGDGFNLIGNPYLSAVQFSKLLNNGIEAQYWVYNPKTGNVDVWNEQAKAGMGSLKGNIASGQGFFVRSKQSGGNILFKEDAKVKLNNGLFSEVPDQRSHLSMIFNLTASSKQDEVLLLINPGSLSSYEETDSYKLDLSHPDAPYLGSSVGTQDLAIDSRSSFASGDTIKLKLIARKGGSHILKVGAISGFDSLYPVLVDLLSSTRYPLNESFNLEMNLFQGQILSNYIIVFASREVFSSVPNRCFNDSSGYLSAIGPGSGPYQYTWKNNQGQIIQSTGFVSRGDTIRNVPNGTYSVEVATIEFPLVISQLDFENPDSIAISSVVNNESCPENNDGSIYTTVSGGTGNLFAFWSTGSFNFFIENLRSGSYTLLITDAVGCSKERVYSILEPDTLVLGLSLPKDTFYLNELVRPSYTSNRTLTEWTWNFGDGFLSTTEFPAHAYQTSGIFTIQLRAGNGFCERSVNKSLFVLPTTGVGEIAEGNGLAVFEQIHNGLQIKANQTLDEWMILSLDGSLLDRGEGIEKGQQIVVAQNIQVPSVVVVLVRKGEKASSTKIWFH